ncbi:ceramidase like protein [Teratosphaeria nubilosa]|uniref:Neutral ceramidase n=1 Tax=Teratosphaeria nubilosa TaxID=161662 RepID=A0A6G1L811_9PEZI|nr:ceramidase like protein [Teratosphaeria nubilosa]
MARQPFILALAAGLIILLSTVNIFHRLNPDSLPFPWQRSGSVNPFKFLGSQHLPGGDSSNGTGDIYLLGVGKADITGPVVEINFMGYADTKQVGSGLRQRLYSRAFIIGDVDKPEDRFVYLVLDTQSGDTAVRHGILDALQGLGDDFAVYGNQNIAVTGTHSHSGPGAWLNYLLPQITSYGFNKPSYQAIVDGAVASIVKAHAGLSPGRLSIGTVEVENANINRSPYAYLANPAEERQTYKHNVDKTMTVLRFTHFDHTVSHYYEKHIGILTWFPVHGTSMYGNNTLVTGDNKGVAAWLFERSMNNTDYVAGFSQANVGDTSPSVEGAFCEYGEQAGEKCDFKTSLCGNRTQPCHGRGPFWGLDDGGTASNYEIGRRQFEAARQLYANEDNFMQVTGKAVKSFHKYADLSTYHFTLPNGSNVRTCPAALGYSFAAGTTDGPGAFDFKQAQPDEPHANPLWSLIGNRVHKPNETQIACQGEKPILLDVGESDDPYAWSPNIVDLQVLRVGNFFIIVSPGEATTMAGRRWKDAVKTQAAATFEADFKTAADEPTVVLGGPANTYAHYITTPEEYSIQRYEGASTLYGPHTLNAYIDLTTRYLRKLASNSSISPQSTHGPIPPNNVDASLSFIMPVVLDRAPVLKSFGDVKEDVKPTYKPGETVSATFVGANPRNNFRLGGTFAALEQFDFDVKAWRQVKDDSDWSLVYEWKRTNSVLGTSEVRVSWETKWEVGSMETEVGGVEPHGGLAVRESALQGLYRLRYFGDAKAFGGTITAFEGVSGEFRIV